MPTKLGGQKQWVCEGVPPFWQLREISLERVGVRIAEMSRKGIIVR